MSWITEGVSTRSRWGHPSPVVHLVLTASEQLWCTGSNGRLASVHHEAVQGYPPPRRSTMCAQLAAEAIADDTLDARDAGRFAP